MNQLQGMLNIFGGIEISPEALPDSEAEFAGLLDKALPAWQEQGRKLVWLEIPTRKSALVPVAVTAGFDFHHVSNGNLTLTKRLQENAFIPPDASHYVGAGGAVFAEDGKLLVVVEKVHATERPQYYKLPGGLVEEGESIVGGVMREVFEETGISTRFDSLICFRHSHHWRFDKSALYFICRLLPLSREITVEEAEIAEARWMPVDDFLANPHVSLFNKHIVRLAWEQSGMQPSLIEGYQSTSKDTEFFSVQISNHDHDETPDL